ncbi:signal recognition particle, SRP14 subunit [Kalaharituber pfeilii]|nr:signal recognition particle, SRP14 subunit [Kalaharituber pfeilii]
MQERVSNDEFFQKLAELFAATTKKESGSVFLTQKRLIPHDQKPASAAGDPLSADLALLDAPGPLLIRATNGASNNKNKNKNKNKGSAAAAAAAAAAATATNKIKFSTVVEPDAIDAFYVRYAEVWKTGMTALKKRDRRKKNKKKKSSAKAKEAAAGES